MSSIKLTLKLLNEKYGVCKLDKNEIIPTWSIKGDFFSITKTEDELSIVCLQENIAEDVKSEKER